MDSSFVLEKQWSPHQCFPIPSSPTSSVIAQTSDKMSLKLFYFASH